MARADGVYDGSDMQCWPGHALLGGFQTCVCAVQGGQKYGFFRKSDFLECREKKSEFDLGSAFFGISDLGFLPYGVHIKGVIEKRWNFDEKC